MSKQERINKLMNEFNSFKEKEYYKEEYIEELERLEIELIEKTFNKEHVDASNLKICHVEKHLEELNEQANHVADTELNDFKEKAYALVNEIKKFKSGNKGERYVSKFLDTLKCPKFVLQNIELSKDNHKAEIDFIVITEKTIFILEVKNTRRNVIIDEKGNFIKLGRDTIYERPIGENMVEKEYLLRSILDQIGYKNPNIMSYVVFTDSKIEVENKCEFVNHTFASCLAHIIYNNSGSKIYSLQEMKKISNKIKMSEIKQKYAPSFDVESIKKSFVKLLVKLEEESKMNEQNEVIESKPAKNILTKVLVGGSIAASSLIALKLLSKSLKHA